MQSISENILVLNESNRRNCRAQHRAFESDFMTNVKFEEASSSRHVFGENEKFSFIDGPADKARNTETTFYARVMSDVPEIIVNFCNPDVNVAFCV